MKTKSIFLILLLVLFTFSSFNYGHGTVKKARDGIFIHVSKGSEDAHRVLMALNMALIMSETKDVVMYFDIKGVYVLLKDAENITFNHFPGSHEQIKKLLAKGIIIMACPGCLKAAGKSPKDLMSGIRVADKEKFFNFTKGRILTIDY